MTETGHVKRKKKKKRKCSDLDQNGRSSNMWLLTFIPNRLSVCFTPVTFELSLGHFNTL